MDYKIKNCKTLLNNISVFYSKKNPKFKISNLLLFNQKAKWFGVLKFIDMNQAFA